MLLPDLKNVRPITKAENTTVVQFMQNADINLSAGANADSEPKDEVPTSSSNCGNTHVEPTPSVNFTARIKVRPYRFIKINYDAKKMSTAK